MASGKSSAIQGGACGGHCCTPRRRQRERGRLREKEREKAASSGRQLPGRASSQSGHCGQRNAPRQGRQRVSEDCGGRKRREGATEQTRTAEYLSSSSLKRMAVATGTSAAIVPPLPVSPASCAYTRAAGEKEGEGGKLSADRRQRFVCFRRPAGCVAHDGAVIICGQTHTCVHCRAVRGGAQDDEWERD